MTTTATASTAIKLAGAFRSQAIFESSRDSATDAARILANAELPAAVGILVSRVEKHFSALAGLDEVLSDPNVSDATVATLAKTRKAAEAMLNETRACLLAVALGSASRMEGIAPVDRPALCDVILAR